MISISKRKAGNQYKAVECKPLITVNLSHMLNEQMIAQSSKLALA